jgi:hypothetical protein
MGRFVVLVVFAAIQLLVLAGVIDANNQRIRSDQRLCAMIQGADCSYFEFKK